MWIWDKLYNEKHCLAQLLYLSIVAACGIGFVATSWHLVSAWEQTLFCCLISISLLSFFMASFSDPGYIHSKNLRRALEMTDYDYILYFPKDCYT